MDTAGAEVVGRISQQIASPSPATLIGEGKVEEVGRAVADAGATLVIFDEELSPVQGANLERELKVRVMDRPEVILDIFSTRARSHEAKLQVELAQLEYLLPRLTRMWTHLSRIRGGIGLRGPGETQLETDRRIIRQRIQGLKAKLKGVERHRENLRAGRRPDAERRAGGLHQRRQVERAARALRPARDLRRGPAVRDARHADPRGGAGRRAARAGDRHGRLHPQAAPPSGRELPGHAGGGPRRRTCCSTSWTRAIPTGKARCAWSSGCWPSSTWPTGRSSRCSTRWTPCPTRPASRRGCGSCIPARSRRTTMRTDGLASLKARLRELERAGRPTVRVRLPVTDGARLAALYREGEVLSREDGGEACDVCGAAGSLAGGASCSAEGWRWSRSVEGGAAGGGVATSGRGSRATWLAALTRHAAVLSAH